jgi:uncharacterized membrane protein
VAIAMTPFSRSLVAGERGEGEEWAMRPQARAARAAERIVATAGGAALLGLAGRRRRLAAMGLALAGAPLLYRGLTGRWPGARQWAAVGMAPIEVEAAVTIARSAIDLYTFWRKLENLPRFMHGLDSVSEEGTRSHWVGHLQFGLRPQWDAEILEDLPGKLLSWRSLPGAGLHNAGIVVFDECGVEAAGRGTVVRVILELMPPGTMGRAVGKALRSATEQQVREDLRRFKCLMEAGEVPSTAGQPAGRAGRESHNPF